MQKHNIKCLPAMGEVGVGSRYGGSVMDGFLVESPVVATFGCSPDQKLR